MLPTCRVVERTQLSIGSLPESISPPKPGRASLNRWFIAIVIIALIVMGGLFTLIYYTNAQVSTETFSYNPPPSQGSYTSLTLSNVDGLVTIVPWSQPTVLINGTVTARGLGSSLSVVKITNSSTHGNIIFQAAFPVNPGFFFSQSYNVKINVFIPSMIRFNYVRVSNVNGGVRINSLNSTSLNLTTTNGTVSVDCVYCLNMTASSTNGSISTKFETPIAAGSFNMTSTNANVDFSAPSSSSFKISATAVTGSIQVSGWAGVIPTTQNSFNHIFGAGGANVNLKSVNGQITITGTLVQ